jgi:hypothetical protein
MIRTKPLLALSVVALTILGGCNSSAPAPTPSADEPAGETAVAATAEPEATAAPKIEAEEPVFDFGSIKPTERVDHVFKIKNTGTADLKIERVQRT